MNGCQHFKLFALQAEDSLRGKQTLAGRRRSLLQMRFFARLQAVRGVPGLLYPCRGRRTFLRNLHEADFRPVYLNPKRFM
jgi:hypothetical protein